MNVSLKPFEDSSWIRCICAIFAMAQLASGLPVAAYNVTDPADVFADGVGGVLSNDLGQAAIATLNIDGRVARQKAMAYSWQACADQFVTHVRNAHPRAVPICAEPGLSAPPANA